MDAETQGPLCHVRPEEGVIVVKTWETTFC